MMLNIMLGMKALLAGQPSVPCEVYWGAPRKMIE